MAEEPLIEIVRYRDGWPDEFTILAAGIREALGDTAIRIDHVGSTSVPGLAAKDKIDIQVTVAALDPAIPDVLERAGWIWVREFTNDHAPPGVEMAPADLAKFVLRNGTGIRPANCHIRQAGRYNQRFALLFRDYVRATPQAAAAYQVIKETLAGWFPNDVDRYYDIKDPLFDIIILAAEHWATATNWNPS